jgi:dihydroxyacid dehydratase/phosphogluconate dehydratase
MTPRLVDVLPNGPVGHPTVRVFMAGAVPEVMLYLRGLSLLRLDAITAQGVPLGDTLESWERSERRKRLRERLFEQDGIDPDDVVMNPDKARERADQYGHLSDRQSGARRVGQNTPSIPG